MLTGAEEAGWHDGGAQPKLGLQAALTGWLSEEAKRMAVRVWRGRDDDPQNGDRWTALGAEVAAAGGVDGPEL